MRMVTIALLLLLSVSVACSKKSTRRGSGGTSVAGVVTGAFSLQTPANGATGISLTPSPAVVWTDATGETSYTVELDTDSGFSVPLVWQSTGVAADATTVQIPAGTLAASTQYFWRVTAILSAGPAVASNAPFSFTTVAAAPTAFTLTAPTNGAPSNTATPTLTWIDSSGEQQYMLQIDNDSAFSAPILSQVNAIPANTTSYTVSAGLLTGAGPYYWRVYASNSTGQTLASNAPWSFSVLLGPVANWSKAYGGNADETGFCVRPTSDGGYVVAGVTASFGSGDQAWVLKLASNGTVSWEKMYGDAGNQEFRSIWQTSDGGYIATGMSRASGTTNDEVYLVRLDSSGTPVWQRTVGGANRDFGMFVQQTSDSGYIVSGAYSPVAGQGYEAWLLKFDSAGTLTWVKQYAGIPANGMNNDVGYCVQQTTDGGYIFGCSSDTFGSLWDAWILKLDSAGMPTWQKRFSDPGHNYAKYVQQTSDGGYIFCGDVQSNFHIVKLTSAGVSQWQKTVDLWVVDYAEGVQQTTDGGYVMVGQNVTQDCWLGKFDGAGSLQWGRSYGSAGEDRLLFVRQASDGGYAMAGDTKGFGAVGRDMWVVKTATDGSVSATLGTASALTAVDANIPSFDTSAGVGTSVVTPVTVTFPATATASVVTPIAP